MTSSRGERDNLSLPDSVTRTVSPNVMANPAGASNMIMWQNKAALSPPLRIQWVLTERDGKLVANHMENVYGTAFEWEYGSPRILREIGEGTGGAIARVVRPQVASETAEAVNPSGLWIRPISDAPGDGNFSLTRAIGFALSDSGLKIAEDRMQAKHVLKGNVRVDSPVSGRQNVEIAWTVIDRKGKELGNAVQRNAVPEGTLDGRWGQTAVMIAMAAVGGIKDILLDVERNRRTRGNPLFSSRLDLPAEQSLALRFQFMNDDLAQTAEKIRRRLPVHTAQP